MDERTSRWNSNIGLFSFPPCVGEGQDGGGINIPPPLSSPVRGEEMKNKVAKWQKTLNQKSRR